MKEEEQIGEDLSKLENAEAEELDKHAQWPLCIEMSQQWLIKNEVRVLEYIKFVEEFVQKIFTEV